MPRSLLNLVWLVLTLAPAGAQVAPPAEPPERDLSEQVQIPAGSYLLGETATPTDLGPFEIDKYEVTIGEYAKFIEFCQTNRDNPDAEHKYDHPRSNQLHVSHVNRDVLALIENAKRPDGTVFSNKEQGIPGIPINFNYPMVAVTFWDAYAYAHWKGRDLPTEEEWEAVARGPKGAKYPWGDEQKLSNFNSNEGYQALSSTHKPEDGYNYWAPVDRFSKDESPLKVVGMAGNVAEWAYKKEVSKEIPMIKGSSFATPPVPMFARTQALPAEDCWFVLPAKQKANFNKKPQTADSEYYFVNDPVTANIRTLYIGFRTVKRK